MKKQEKRNPLSLPRASTSELRGRQSVRATFRLTEGAISAISIMASHLGIKQKSLIDQLLEDRESLRQIAEEIQGAGFELSRRVQKTYVISRRTLACLQRAAESFDAPRDALVELSIQRLMPLIAAERRKHLKRKEIVNELEDYLKEGQKMLAKYRDTLGEDDPVYGTLESALAGLGNAWHNLSSFIERCEMIETL
jgi:hypothetical protein